LLFQLSICDPDWRTALRAPRFACSAAAIADSCSVESLGLADTVRDRGAAGDHGNDDAPQPARDRCVCRSEKASPREFASEAVSLSARSFDCHGSHGWRHHSFLYLHYLHAKVPEAVRWPE